MTTLQPSKRSRGEHSTQTIDLTAPPHKNSDINTTAMPLHYPSSSKRHLHSRSHHTFNHAYHRIVSRQERQYDRTNPNLFRECVDVSEEHRDHPIREQALAHVTRAYVAVGYTHATLTVLVSAVCAALLLAISYAVASDVARKTRARATELVASAAECSVRIRENYCLIDGDHVSHGSSYEMAELCKKWVTCARRGEFADSDAHSAKVWAETLADIVNTFAERLSSTTIAVTAAMLIVLSIVFSSSAFNFLHRRVADDSILARHHHHHQPHVPPTPLVEHSPMPQQQSIQHRQPATRYIDYKSDSHSQSSSRR